MPKTQLGILRIELIDDWTVKDFAHLLQTIDSSYERLNAFFKISDDFDDRIHSSFASWKRYRRDFPFPEPPIVLLQPDSTALYEPLIKGALRETSQLEIYRLELHSPGFADFIAHLNPLKFIADVIKHCQQHDIEKRKIESKERMDMKKLESKERLEAQKIDSQERIERHRVDADVFNHILDRRVELRREGTGPLMEQFIHLTSEEPIEGLLEIARDVRITRAESVPLSDAQSLDHPTEGPHPDD